MGTPTPEQVRDEIKRLRKPSLETRKGELEAEISRLRADLFECYKLSGAEPHGVEHDWDAAVREVRAMREELDQADAQVIDLENKVAELTRDKRDDTIEECAKIVDKAIARIEVGTAELLQKGVDRKVAKLVADVSRSVLTRAAASIREQKMKKESNG